MIIQAVQGRDIQIDANSHVILRVQGWQWRIDKPASGTAVLPGRWTRNLKYYGNKKIVGDVWIGKSHYVIHINPRS